jgi:hypothetical protein
VVMKKFFLGILNMHKIDRNSVTGLLNCQGVKVKAGKLFVCSSPESLTAAAAASE